jgi:hypothetical protein
MTIESIELQMDITDLLGSLNTEIEINLQKWGEPLRWAITAVDRQTNIAHIEAIVIRL